MYFHHWLLIGTPYTTMLYARQMLSVESTYEMLRKNSEFPHQTLPPSKASKAARDTEQTVPPSSCKRRQPPRYRVDFKTTSFGRFTSCQCYEDAPSRCMVPLALPPMGQHLKLPSGTKLLHSFSYVRSRGAARDCHLAKRHCLEQELCKNKFPSLAVRVRAVV